MRKRDEITLWRAWLRANTDGYIDDLTDWHREHYFAPTISDADYDDVRAIERAVSIIQNAPRGAVVRTAGYVEPKPRACIGCGIPQGPTPFNQGREHEEGCIVWHLRRAMYRRMSAASDFFATAAKKEVAPLVE